MAFDDLLRELLAASDDAARAEVAGRLGQVPDALPLICQRIVSTDRAARWLGLSVLSRFVPAPVIFHHSLQHCLQAPIDRDPLGDERALVLVCASQMPRAIALDPDRGRLAAAVAETERADGPRAEVMQRLARAALAAVDAVRAEDAQKWRHDIELVAGHMRAGRDDEACALVAAGARDANDRWQAAVRWEAAGDLLRASDRMAARACYQRALEGFGDYAGDATSGSEGMERLPDARRVEDKLTVGT